MHKRVTVIGLSGQSIFIGVDRFPRIGETVSSTDVLIECGGKGFNQAITLARFGVDTAFISVVGDDEYGRECRKVMADAGVKTHFVQKPYGTSFAVIHRDKRGDNVVTVYKGVSGFITAADIENARELIVKSDFLLLQLELPIETVYAAVDIAEKHGVQAILNPAPAAQLNDDLLRRFCLITPNEIEARVLLKYDEDKELSPSELAREFFKKGIHRFIITMGNKGALVGENGTATMIHAIEVEAVDTTGAGDVFNGALTAMLAKGYCLLDAAKFAVNASAISVTKKGVFDSIPTFEITEKNYVEPFCEKFKIDL
ncbi:MAG: ribokinase [Clostridiales bacterium]|nr:ribokinase [Clostridiales bacterium]